MVKSLGQKAVILGLGGNAQGRGHTEMAPGLLIARQGTFRKSLLRLQAVSRRAAYVPMQEEQTQSLVPCPGTSQPEPQHLLQSPVSRSRVC